MCTVTFTPTKSGFIFASNRDEQPTRKTMIPAFYNEEGVGLFYPKDEVAGGTWIGLSEKERLVCLLNGGFVYHDPKTKFPNSRGLVVKKLLVSNNVLQELEQIDLTGVAPFTLLVVDTSKDLTIYELVWCRGKKYVKVLNTQEAHIWSSSTLYTDAMKEERKQWFSYEFDTNEVVSKQDVLEFHKNEYLGTIATAPKMKRDVVETISTTVIEKNETGVVLDYIDYVADKAYNYKDVFQNNTILK